MPYRGAGPAIYRCRAYRASAHCHVSKPGLLTRQLVAHMALLRLPDCPPGPMINMINLAVAGLRLGCVFLLWYGTGSPVRLVSTDPPEANFNCYCNRSVGYSCHTPNVVVHLILAVDLV